MGAVSLAADLSLLVTAGCDWRFRWRWGQNRVVPVFNGTGSPGVNKEADWLCFHFGSLAVIRRSSGEPIDASDISAESRH